MYQSKTLNMTCVCKTLLRNVPNGECVILEPCDHIYHSTCLKTSHCPICQEKIKNKHTIKSLHKLLKTNISNKERKIAYQRYVDLMAVIPDVCDVKINSVLLCSNLPKMLGIISTIPFLSGFEDGKTYITDEIFRIMNVRLVINHVDKYIPTKKCVIISKHSSYFDFLVMSSVFQCGYLSSSIIKKIWIGSMLCKLVPLIIIDRGKTKGTVEQMKEYIKDNRSICVFPEGTMYSEKTLGKFRTGCFHTGYPVLPITIKYEPYLSEYDTTVFFQKMLSLSELKITVTIGNYVEGPFDDTKIEQVRIKMAKSGGYALSNVSNRDHVD